MAGMNRMTEAQMKEAYKFIVEHAFTMTRRQISEELKISLASIHSMAKRLEKAGIDLPRGLKSSVLKDTSFVEELKEIADKARPTE